MAGGEGMKARSWTGRVCALDHDCFADTLHRAADGVAWRGNADINPNGPLPASVRMSFLAMIEAGARDNTAARNEFDLWRGVLFDELAEACGVVWVEDEAREGFWAGPWASNFANWPLFSVEALFDWNHVLMWAGKPWGCEF